MLTSIAVVIAALVMVWAAYARGRKNGYAKGVQEGRLSGWNQYAAQVQERDSTNRAIANRSALLAQADRPRRRRGLES